MKIIKIIKKTLIFVFSNTKISENIINYLRVFKNIYILFGDFYNTKISEIENTKISEIENTKISVFVKDN